MTEPTNPEDQLEVLSEQQCLELLGSQIIGRIAFSDEGQPEIFPVNDATDGAIVVFRSAPGTKLDMAMTSKVAFEVDAWDEARRVGWSVVLKGVCKEVTTGNDPFAATLRTRNVWPLAPGDHDHWIAIYPSEITGRRFRRH